MAQYPTIYTIQASAAPEHTDKLRKILQNLKTENRIDDFTTLGVEDDLSSLTDIMEDGNFILIVLTRGMESQREQINDQLKAFKLANPEAGIAEIIVDNLPYENVFYTLPEDFRPICDREDRDVAWKGIEQSLKELFPKIEPPIDWQKYLKIWGIAVGVMVVFFIIRELLNNYNRAQVVADFNINPTECEKAPCTIEFVNTSKNIDSFRWNFGDGTTSVTTTHPSHTFEEPGLYNVILYASGDGYTDYKVLHITVPEPAEEPIPEVTTEVFISQFEIPEGLKFSCLSGDEPDIHIPHSSYECPVLKWMDYTYWALSFVDNRTSMAILAVNSEGEIAERWYQPGARYLWKIELDAEAETATFIGQAYREIIIEWDELGIE